ncbi:MAG: 3D domain-containing protein [Chloroflexota bacterium]
MLNTATGATRLVSNLCDYRLPFHLARAACALLLGLIFWQPGLAHAQATACETYRITGYVRGAHSPWTYDGTSVWTQEPIAAASWNVPINSVVQVEGTGVFRVADRGGGLSARHIDILVNSRAEALAITGWRQVCMLKSGHAKPTVNARLVNRATQTLGPIPR